MNADVTSLTYVYIIHQSRIAVDMVKQRASCSSITRACMQFEDFTNNSCNFLILSEQLTRTSQSMLIWTWLGMEDQELYLTKNQIERGKLTFSSSHCPSWSFLPLFLCKGKFLGRFKRLVSFTFCLHTKSLFYSSTHHLHIHQWLNYFKCTTFMMTILH